MSSLVTQVPSEIVGKWQEIVDLLAEVMHVPSALVMKVEPPDITVFVSSESKGNPYAQGEVSSLNTGLYCETVMKTRQPLLVPDALVEEEWKSNPDIKLGMISYLGFPIAWPDGRIFGTICVLDNKRNEYSEPYRKLLLQFREVLQADLRWLAELGGELATQKVHLKRHIARIAIERHRSQQTLREALEQVQKSGAKLRQVIDTIPTQAYCILPDGRNEFSNKRWEEYTGLSSEESSGWRWQAAFHPEDLPGLMEKHLALLAAGEPEEIQARLRRHDGVYRWFLFRTEPLRDETGKIIRWYGTSTDIDDLKRAEDKLRQDEEELRRMTDAIPQTIIVLNPDGKAIYANRVALEYTGLSLDEVLADDFRARVFHPDDVQRLREERRQALSDAAPFENEQRALGKDGKYRWFLIQYNPLLDENGNVIHWYATGTDIDDRKRAEDRMRNENVALREEIVRSSMFEEIVGSSESLREVLAQVFRVAPTDSTVLIQGETGTGKELIARAIHVRSKRSSRAFIRVNCAAIPPSLIASELFGHEKGSFTGAVQRRLGRFESADGGTIFLDEIGELPPETQVALLRVLQEREYERVGGNQTIAVDVRVLAASNRDLSAAVTDGTFRRDLFYRLNVFPLQLPALRDRVDDIPLLVEYLVDRFAKKAGKRIRSISKDTLNLFQNYEWPGNIRELQNVIERAVILCDGEIFCVDPSWLVSASPNPTTPTIPLVADLAEREKAMIENALREAEGRISGPSGAAAKLGIRRQTLEFKIRKLGINWHRFRTS